MTTQDLAIFVAAMVLATQASRLSPLIFSGVPISPSFERWLAHVPIAILSAMVLPEFFTEREGRLELNLLFLLTGVVCVVVGVKSKNLLLTTVVGVVLVALSRTYL